MQLINFHSEHPASQDVFPGGSHDKVATAIHDHLLSNMPSKIVGLDGGFGSGKSSILNMLKDKLTKSNADFRVWFFDCEQNYQGSTKSNFIELFTYEALKEVPTVSKAAETLKASRDRALGRLFEYTKKTTSRVSAWALALVASLFFASTSFREIFALSRKSLINNTSGTPDTSMVTSIFHETSLLLITVHCISLLSPLLILVIAKLCHWRIKVGGHNWSLLSLFKGTSDDHISEKIEVGKEVTPLDLKRTLLEQLKIIEHKRFVIILDNLDRLPKDSLRSVWSDLEIFITVATEAANLTVIVPFCSTKVADYLKADGDRQYDAKDFIAKKFPVVFRSPPVITSGWKDGFRQLWSHTFPSVDSTVIDLSAQLLQRHSPMANNLVTPRLQKKFINDIATTSLVVGNQISLLAIAAYLLLCKYAEQPLIEILRTDGLSRKHPDEIEKPQIELINETKRLLSTVLGNTMETGWQIQFLQIHYLTTSDIAIAELLDTPLKEAFDSKDYEALANLTSLFGFSDAMKRFLTGEPILASLLSTISAAHQKHGGEWIRPLLGLINTAQLELFGESEKGSEDFYEAFRYCKDQGLSESLLTAHGDELKAKLMTTLNSSFELENLELARQLLCEYDLYLYAKNVAFEKVVLKRAEYLMHLLPDFENLRVIESSAFTLHSSSFVDAHLQLVSCPAHPLNTEPLPSQYIVPALEWLYAERKLGNGLGSTGLKATDVSILAKIACADEDDESAIMSLALAETVDQSVKTAITTLLASNDSLLSKAVGAITYIRQKDTEALTKIEELDDVFESSVFRTLAKAVISTTELFALLSDEQVGNSIAGLLAHLIEERLIGSLSCVWVAKNFNVLVKNLEPYGLSDINLLSWLAPWDIHIEKNCQDVIKADPLLIELILNCHTVPLPETREGVIEQLRNKEMTKETWVSIILEGAEQHLNIIKTITKEQIFIPTVQAISDALTEVINDIANSGSKKTWGQAQYAIIDALLNILDDQQKMVIGIRMRSLLFSESVEPQALSVPLARYGHLIPDIQPNKSHEVLRIVLFLDLLSRNPESTTELAKFFDARAEQIATFKYSAELKKAMGEAVTKLSEITPDLYKKFSKTKGFVRLIQSLTKKMQDKEDELISL